MQDVACGGETIPVSLSFEKDEAEAAARHLQILQQTFIYSSTLKLPAGLDDLDEDAGCTCEAETCQVRGAGCECIETFGEPAKSAQVGRNRLSNTF